MKKLLTLSVIGTSLIIGSNTAKAEWDYWAIDHDGSTNRVFTCVSSTGTCTQRTTRDFEGGSWNSKYTHVNDDKIYVQTGGSNFEVYDLSDNSWTTISNWAGNFQDIFEKDPVTKTEFGDLKVELLGTKIIEVNSDGTVQIGSDANDIDITSEGLTIDGEPI